MHAKELVITGILVLGWTLHGLGMPTQEAAERKPATEALFIPAGAALEVAPDADGMIGLADVLARFQEITDWTVLMDEETRRLVERSRVHASGALKAHPKDVVRVVEAFLANANFVWSVARAEAPRLLSLKSLNTTARTSARMDAEFVPVSEIQRYADFPATLVQTVISLPHLDVRTLSNSMRGMVVDPNTLQFVPAGNSAGLLLQGSGRALADFTQMLTYADARAAAEGNTSPAATQAPFVVRAESDFTLPGGDENALNLLQLVQIYAEQTGMLALLSQESSRLLDQTPIQLLAPITVSAEDFPAMFQELLRDREFVYTSWLDGDSGIFTVRSLHTNARTAARADGRYVDAGSLERCAAYPATIFSTVISLPHSDVRTLSNSMRGMVVDPNLLQIIPLGNSDSLLIQGRGREITQIAAMLSAHDAAEALRPKIIEEAPVEPGAPEEGN